MKIGIIISFFIIQFALISAILRNVSSQENVIKGMEHSLIIGINK